MGLPLSLIGNIIITCSPVPCIWFLPHCFQVAFSSNTNITTSFASLRCLCFPTGKSKGPALCMARKVLWYSATLNYLSDYTFLLPIFMALHLPSLPPCGLATIYLDVKPRPRLHHLCPVGPLYTHSSIVRPASW